MRKLLLYIFWIIVIGIDLTFIVNEWDVIKEAPTIYALSCVSALIVGCFLGVLYSKREIANRDSEIRILERQVKAVNYDFYEDTLARIKRKGVEALITIEKINREEENPHIKGMDMPCSVKRLSEIIGIEYGQADSLVRELKSLNLAVSPFDGIAGFYNSAIPIGGQKAVHITQKGKEFLTLHRLKEE